MNTTNYIRIFRGDDSDALGYQTIVGTIKTDLDLTGCKAVFRFLGFYAEFNPIPEDKKLTIVIPAQASRGFPPGVGYASLKVFDSLGKIRTFTNRIPVIVDTMTPSCGCGEFEVSFSPFPELEPLKIFIGPNADDFDQYTGFVSKIIDRASLVKYGLAILADAMSEDGGASGKAASPLAVKAAYDAIIKELVDNYYTAEQTDEAIDRVAAYYITRNAAGDAFETKAQLDSTTVFYSGGKVRVPTRNDYCVILADETHDNAEYRYIYAVADGQTIGSWQPQFPVEGVMTVDQTVQRNRQNPVSGGGVWSMIWGALSALPTGFSSLYDWCVAQLAGKASKADVDPLLFAQYYPEGNVKSAAEFTAGIKYGSFDDVHRTVSVLPFGNTGDSDNDNSSLSGRVVIPPFVDNDGNPYISDDGTRFKVVGTAGISSVGFSQNALTAIVTPNTVTSIGESAFTACTSLTSASFPAVTSIGRGAFTACTSLTSASFPAATDVGEAAFASCTSLTSASFPAATDVGEAALFGCTSLASVDFGAILSSVPTLGINAFSNVLTTCKIIVPDAQYDAWTAPTLPDGSSNPWYVLVTARHQFLRHSEWEYARKYETVPTSRTVNGKALTSDVNIEYIERDSDIIYGDRRYVAEAFGPRWAVLHNRRFSVQSATYTDTGPNGVPGWAFIIRDWLQGKNIYTFEPGGEGDYSFTIDILSTTIHLDRVVRSRSVHILALTAGEGHPGNLAALDADGNPTDSTIPAANVALKGDIPYDRITITTGQLQDHAEQKVTLNAATTTLTLPALTDLTGKVSDFGIDMVNGYAPEVGGTPTPTAASFQLDGTIGTDYNIIVPEGEDWGEMSTLAAGEMAVYYFTLSAFAINDKPTWEVMKKVVTLVPVPSAP